KCSTRVQRACARAAGMRRSSCRRAARASICVAYRSSIRGFRNTRRFPCSRARDTTTQKPGRFASAKTVRVRWRQQAPQGSTRVEKRGRVLWKKILPDEALVGLRGRRLAERFACRVDQFTERDRLEPHVGGELAQLRADFVAQLGFAGDDDDRRAPIGFG